MPAPRDMREWMHSIERNLALYKGIPRIVADTIQIVREEQGAKDVRHPTAPIELTYQTALYMDRLGRSRTRFLMDFPDVVKATDGTDIQVDRYELWGKDETVTLLARTTSAVAGIAEPGITLPGLAATPWNIAIEQEEKPWERQSSNTESYFRVDGYLPGTTWRFRARAYGHGMATPGEWSEEIVVVMEEDETPPPQPSPPTAVADRGTITVAWNGQSVLGPMPADFKYAILAHGTASAPTFEIFRFGRAGGFTVVADIPYYVPQHFRLAAVDESGNMGPWSEEVVAFTTPMVDKDIILSTIDAAKVHLKNINAGVSILPDTIITEHLVITEDMTAAIANFLKVNVDMLNANEIWSDELWVGYADAKLVRSDMFIGKEFFGGTFTGTKFQTSVEEYTGITLDSNGLKAYNAAGAETFSIDAVNGMVTQVGRLYTSVAGKPGIAIVPPAESWNEQDMGIFFAGDSHQLTGHVTAGIWMADPQESSVINLNLRGSNYGGVNIWNGLTLKMDGTGQPRIDSSIELQVVAGGDVVLDAGPGKTVNLRSDGEPYAMTSSGAANVYMYSTGQLFKSTSSQRYKTDIQDWHPDLRALGLRPRSWVDRNPVNPDDPLHRYYGFVAEEVEQVLPEMVTYNDAGQPESVQYERFAAALVPVMANMMDRIEALERK